MSDCSTVKGMTMYKPASLLFPCNFCCSECHSAVLSIKISSTGAVAGAVVAVVGLLLLTGTAVVVVIRLKLFSKSCMYASNNFPGITIRVIIIHFCHLSSIDLSSVAV